MFNYLILKGEQILGRYENTNIEFDRLSPPQENFVISNEMKNDIRNGKYDSRFYLMSDINNEQDNKTLDNMYKILKSLENQENINLIIKIQYSNLEYSTILLAKNINYVARVTRNDTNIINQNPRLYNQVNFLCNIME